MATTFNPYKITWIEFRPLKGFVTKADQKKIDSLYGGSKNKAIYRHFASKEKALQFIETLKSVMLAKQYVCTMFTDQQFGLATTTNGDISVKFTAKQIAERITI